MAEAERWNRTEQLLALLIEVVSIKVAGKSIKKPIDIDRPGKKDKGKRVRHNPEQRDLGEARVAAPTSTSARTPVASDRDAAFKSGIAVLAGSARRKG